MTTQMPEPVATLVDAVNAHDEDAFLACFADDGYVDDWGRVFRGRTAIDGWSSKELIGAHGTLSVWSVATTETGNVVVVGDWRSTHANGVSRFEFEVAGGEVASMTIRDGEA
ncbi:nuclear transport factor 2 family protein [Pimelobacter simplex]|uniref:Nuclear transport factor 2 family protein n=1 Tax=Nocardioides simplex TaxID=2045 RepID=A0A7J5E385_NOCSI|nr:nuclear transport factor 2 family protein [Pimelobacter simplex]KAB2812698.1 nuclear transport factor 2 family protein [Pimelobacter simplex]